MFPTIETTWLFARGPESVRIIRAARPHGAIQLRVEWPHAAPEAHAFDDVIECVEYQSQLERRLVAQGFALERFATARSAGRRRGH